MLTLDDLRGVFEHSPWVAERAWRKQPFASIDALVSAERACIWTLGGLLDDPQFARLLHAARRVLAPFVRSDGSVTFEMPVLVIVAHKARFTI